MYSGVIAYGYRGLHMDWLLQSSADLIAVYNRYRFLNPSLGRFMTIDPSGYVDGLNLYCAFYAMHDELDPLGLGMSTSKPIAPARFRTNLEHRTAKYIEDALPQGQTLLIAARSHHNDAVDAIAENHPEFTGTNSALDFLHAANRLHRNCMNTQRDRNACCIARIVKEGHQSSHLGGGQTFSNFTENQMEQFRGILCKGLEFIELGCNSYLYSSLPTQVLRILGEIGGGTYEGYPCSTKGVYPYVTAGCVAIRITIARALTDSQIQDLLDSADQRRLIQRGVIGDSENLEWRARRERDRMLREQLERDRLGN